MTLADHPARITRCPRCGYDLRGVIGLWTDSCPLNGTCSECGLGFAWRELLSEHERPPRWCVEVGPASALPRTIPRTLLRMFRPGRFWRELKMRLPLRWRRLFAINIACLALLYISFSVISAGTAGAYLLKVGTSRGTTITADEPTMILRTLMVPWTSEPLAVVNYGGGFQSPLSSPAELLQIAWYRGFLGVVTLIAIGTLFIMPLVFIVLPIARRRAKVKWAHIARIALYTPMTLLVPLALFFAADMLRSVERWTSGSSLFIDWLCGAAEVLIWILPASWLMFVWWWWRCACRHYLRMSRAWLVAMSIVIISVLLSTSLAWLYDPNLFSMVFTHQFRQWL